ncbi:adenylate kinase [Clostridium swellfunianum]|uniref:adenylate kinase n=1 Tax=Clostridium swellfunianum TaxID=1367462 RepID=UPI002030A26C|nr:adenylate kinase [Clostridium swellfunianum]MCM0650719.1 adenylate kinase [Clostridium swellfunianum]
MRIVLLGAPGSGKGTQAKLICDYFKIPHISTGDIFRAEIKKMTPLGLEAKKYIQRGNLVPDDLTISIVKESLNKSENSDGFLLDGFPRNIYQAKKLNLLLTEDKKYIDKVYLIDVTQDVILERIGGRRYCSRCGASYHIRFNPSKLDDRCEACGEVLIHRSDDKEDIVLDRLTVYNKAIQPIVNYYKKLGILEKIHGDANPSEIFSSIRSSLMVV